MNKLSHVFALLIVMVPIAFSQTPSARVIELRKERNEVQRELNKVTPADKELDPGLEGLERTSIDATKAYQRAIDEHPELQKFKAEKSAATNKLTTAISKKDDAARAEAQKEISEIMRQRMIEAGKKADLEPLAKAAHETSAAWRDARDAALAKHPATKGLSAKLEKINQEIQGEMKKGR